LGWESLLSGEDAARVPARACGITPDGSRRCETREDREQQKRVWEAKTLRIPRLILHPRLIPSANFTGDGKRFEISGFIHLETVIVIVVQ
jgi:hypothetical protein